jgi:hypothetical protein
MDHFKRKVQRGHQQDQKEFFPGSGGLHPGRSRKPPAEIEDKAIEEKKVAKRKIPGADIPYPSFDAEGIITYDQYGDKKDRR